MRKKFICLTTFCLSVFGLAVGNAHGTYFAAYWDGRYPVSWAAENVTTEIRDYFEKAAYEILDADQLKTWMDARIADQEPSVVIFCRDIVPDTVAEENSADCTLRKYLEAGGKVVWYSDMPMFYQGHADGSQSGWSELGAFSILGISGTSWMDNTSTEVTFTAEGADWGLTETWTSNRWTPTDETFTVLAMDEDGNAAAYAKHYLPGDTSRGFVRIWDFPVSAIPSIEDIQKVAEYGMPGNPYARNPNPADGATHANTWATLSWHAGDFAASHDVYLGDNFDDVNDGTHESDTFRGNQTLTYYVAGFSGYAYPDGLVNGTTYYWRIDEVNEADPDSPWRGKVWSFLVPPRKSYNPTPGDASHFVSTENPTLSWTAGYEAKLHTVYFGDDFDTVANATGGTDQGVTHFNPGTLEPKKIYYWRVDESDGITTYKGDVWSFKTAKIGGGIRGDYYSGMNFGTPVLTRIDARIDFNWGEGEIDPAVGADNFSVRWTGEVEAVFTEPYRFYARTDDGVRLWVDGIQLVGAWVDQTASEYSGEVDLVAGNKYRIVMEYYENSGDAVAELRWSSPSTTKDYVPQAALAPPVKASSPRPRNGVTGTKLTPILRWVPGESAVSHEVFFGTDADAVVNADKSSPEYKGSKALGDEIYDPGKLAWYTSYYWRIDEVNTLHPDGPWVGNLWKFTTGDFIVVDDFEDYDTGENQIWYSWIDGLGFGTIGTDPYNPGNGTGAAVGDETSPSYTEETIVHSGRQAMPVSYDNNKQGYAKYSETELTLKYPRDWTEQDVAELSIWFHGEPNNYAEPLYVAVSNITGASAVVVHDNPAAAQIDTWTEWVILLTAFSDQGIVLTNVDRVALGLGNKGNMTIPGGSGKMYFDDIRLYRPAQEPAPEP